MFLAVEEREGRLTADVKRSIRETDGPALRVHSTVGITVTRMVGMLQGYIEQKIGRPRHNLERKQR